MSDQAGVKGAPSAAFRIWEGVYDDFPEEDSVSTFSSDQWIEALAAEAKAAFAALSASGSPSGVSDATLMHEYPLPVLAALAAREIDRPVRILDFGGGMASSFPRVAMSLPREAVVDFHVVEIPALSARGRSILGHIPNLHFHDDLPDPPEQFDIVHAGSAMQYVRDWRSMLKRFADLRPRWMAFGNLLAGPIETFVTRQNYYGRKIPVRFLNLDEFLATSEALGFRLVFRGLMIRTIFGHYQPLPTEHFPPEKRLRHGCNLIFSSDGA